MDSHEDSITELPSVPQEEYMVHFHDEIPGHTPPPTAEPEPPTLQKTPDMSLSQVLATYTRKEHIHFVIRSLHYASSHQRAIIRKALMEHRSTQRYAMSSMRAQTHHSMFPFETASLGMLAANIAAAKIQALYRGWGFRRRQRGFPSGRIVGKRTYEQKFADFLRRFRLPIGPAALVLYAVIRCQAWWRMLVVRIPHRWRGRLQGRVARCAATKIQRCWHKWAARTDKKRIKPPSHVIIQRWWRRFKDRKVFRYFSDLLAFRNAGDPVKMLKSICPTETAYLDPAVGARVRFRLGVRPEAESVPHGYLKWRSADGTDLYWPPTIYYKIFISAPLCDVNSFAPRNYAKKSGVVGYRPADSLAAVRVGRTVFGATIAEQQPDKPMPPAKSPALSRAGSLHATATHLTLFGTTSRQLELSRSPALRMHERMVLEEKAAAITAAKRMALNRSAHKSVAFGKVTMRSASHASTGTASSNPLAGATGSVALHLGRPLPTNQIPTPLDYSEVLCTTTGRAEAARLVGGETRLHSSASYGDGNIRKTVVLSSADESLPADWYYRDDASLNTWRPVALETLVDADLAPAVRLRRRLMSRYQSPLAAEQQGPRTRIINAKRARRKWLLSLYKGNLATDTLSGDTTPLRPDVMDAAHEEVAGTGSSGVLGSGGGPYEQGKVSQRYGLLGSRSDFDMESVTTSSTTDYYPNIHAPVEFTNEELEEIYERCRKNGDIYCNQEARLRGQQPPSVDAPLASFQYADALDFERYRQHWHSQATSKQPSGAIW